MQGTSVLFGQIAVVFGIVIAGVWGATQWTAAALGYQLRLGSPWFDLLGTPIYHPWRLFECNRSINPVLADGFFQEAEAEAGELFHGSSAS
ncbi:TPA: hypothetical protein VDU63_006171 [Pseudomonas aeruginosa]|nr:hypothetical protein [Pseudomonas aeruginosa]